MATLTFSFAAGSETGALLRRMANQLEMIAQAVPDRTPTGAATTLVIDNAPSAGTATFQITGGPYQTGVYPV